MNTKSHHPLKSQANRGQVIAAVLVAIGMGAAIYSGIAVRISDQAQLEKASADSSITSVNVVKPQSGGPAREIVLPGNVVAFSDAAIYARASGYLKRWYVDIGAQVKEGQLLAEIETPELDQQLEQARATLVKSEADLGQAKIKADRWRQLLKVHAVSQEETDEAVSDLAAKSAAVDANRASARRLEHLQSFEKIEAPFAGVITARNIDAGWLIDAGATAQPRELFHLAALDQVRVYVAVPEIDAEAAQPGGEATLTLDEFPGQVFQGRLVRNSNAYDANTRTLRLEVDVDNPNRRLLPGAYAMVHLKVGTDHQSTGSVTVPANTLLFRAEGPRIAVAHEGHAELVPVTIGRDYGNTVEILSGLKPQDSLILDPSDSLVTGAVVKVRTDKGAD